MIETLMFLNCRNLETPFVPKALILKHVRRAHHVPGTTLGTRGDLSNAHHLGFSLLSRGWTRGDTTARLKSVWVQSQNIDCRLPAIVLGFGTLITQSTGNPGAFILEEVGRRIQQIHGYKECFSFAPTGLGRKGRAAVSHIVSNLWGRWGGSTEQFSRFDDVSKGRVQLSYLFILIVFSLKLQIPFSLENKTITLHEWLISVFHWQTAMLFFTKFSEKKPYQRMHMYCVNACIWTYVWGMHALLSFWVRFVLL